MLVLDVAKNAPTGSTTTAMDAAAILSYLENASETKNEIKSVTDVSGKVYEGKGTGGDGIPQACLKIGKASEAAGFTFTIADTFDDVSKVTIIGYGWKTSTAVSVNESAEQKPTSAATEVSFDYILASPTKTIKIYVGSSAFCATQIILYKEAAPKCAYTVTFNSNDGTNSTSSQEFTCGETKALTANSFSRTGYTFAGWATSANGSVAYTDQQLVNLSSTNNDNIPLYAQWTPTQYTITYTSLEGATHSNPTKYTIESETITFTAPSERVGYKFTGWNPASITKGSTGNKTITAQWTEKDLTNYRTTCSTKADPNLSWSANSCVATMEVDNEFPTLTNPYDLLVKFSSSDLTVATIDENGTITLLKSGTTTITASYEEDEDYLSASTSYELTVEAANCRWVETEIGDIDSGDEVVIAMEKKGDTNVLTYALADNNTAASSAPLATEISINANKTINTDITPISTPLIWNIDYDEEGTKNLVIYSTRNVGKWLYSNNDNDGVRIGTNTNKEFKIVKGIGDDAENTFLYHVAQARYLGVYYTTPDWRGYTLTDKGAFPNYIKGQTLKFYKKECLPANEYWVDYELANVVCVNTPPHSQIANDGEDLLLEFVANDGYKLPESISVSIGNNVLPADNDVYAWDNETGELLIVAAEVTDNIIISISGCERLQAPETLESLDVTSKSVTLSWKPVVNADSYTVYVTDGDNDIEESTDECTITITGLTPNTLYTWDVIASATNYCENEHSKDWIEFKTLAVYTVTFTTNGGTDVESQTVDHGTKATEPTDPTKTGYTFAGWYTEPTCTNLFDFNTVITANTTLYAKWTEWSYTITYAKGSPADEITGEHAPGTKMYTSAVTIAGESFFRLGYKQTGWSKTDGGQKDYDLLGIYGTNENVTLYPYWTKVHTITWMADGSQYDEATYLDGETLALPETDPEACQGSEFVGWTDEQNYSHPTTAPDFITAGDAVNADATYYAVYAEVVGESDEVTMQYTDASTTNMTGENDAATIGLDASEWSVIASKGKSNLYPGLNKEGTIRLYYNVDGSNYITVTSSTSKTITDIKITYKTSYNQGVVIVNGNTIAGEELSSDESIQVLRYSVNATEFIIKNGFTSGKNNQVHITQVLIQTGSTTYANYSTTCSATYRVNYELAGGENGCADEGVKVGNDYTICADEPTKTGYTFQHWTDGTNTYEAGATIENVQSNITLTAVWEANTYTITWMANGEEYTTTSHTFDTELQLPADPYTCYGAKTFIGWTEAASVNVDGSDIIYVDENTNPSENKIYYAVFADEVVGEPEEVEATLSFANKAQRTSFSSTQQVWEQNGITLTNDKASAQSNVGDYANPARFYAASSISITAPGNITKIVFTCSEDKYATVLATSIGETSSGTKVTATLDGESNTFSIASLSAQVQMSSLTVTYLSDPELTLTNYTTTPSGCPEIEVAENAYVTSASSQSVKVNVPVKANDFANDMTITAAVEDGNFSVANVSAVADGVCTVTLAYKPTASNTTESATVTLTAKADDNEVTSTTFTVNGRSLPETFAIVAKVGGVWYALPEVGYSSEKHATACPVEVDDALEPTCVKSALANNATWSLRQVYQSSGSGDRYAANGTNVVLKNNQEPAMALNASANNSYLLTGAQFNNYHNSSNASRYEWTLSTTDLKTYTFINAERTDKSINISTSTEFGLHANNIVSDELRLLPIDTYYTILAAQVVEWKDNSVVIMYNGNPTQTAQTSINGTNVGSVTLANVQKDIAVYELPADGLGTKPNQTLSVTIGSEKLLLPTPYMVNSEVTDDVLLGSSLNVQARRDIAKVSNLVILKGGKLTSIGAKTNPYTFRNVTIYGGGTLVVSADKGFGANTLTMRVGGVEDGNYKNLYPQLQLKGTLNNTSGQINLDYLTTNEFYYPLSVPYPVTIADIQYPVEIYGANVKSDNTGSFQFKYYDGAERAAGRTGWIVLDETANPTLNPNTGYAIWGIPKKVKVNGGESTRQKFGIHRLPLKQTAANMMNSEQQSHSATINVYNGSKRDSDNGWNYLGNPFLSHYGDFTTNDNVMKLGKLVWDEEQGAWVVTDEYQRYVVFTNDCQNYTAELASTTAIPAFSAFFIQADQGGAIDFASPNVAAVQSLAARRTEEGNKEITTGIILSGEEHSDRTGLLIADQFTEAYEFNADLSKFDNQDMNLYTISPSGKLAFMAINEELAKQTIPLGYSVSADGMYTIAFDEQRYNRNDIYALYLIDYDRNETTNLLHMDYDFYSDSGASAERFALQVAFAPSTTTDVEYTQVGDILVSREGNTLQLDNLPSDATVTVYDAVGHLIEQHTASQLLQLTLQKGYYLLHIGNNQHSVVMDTFIP